MSAISGNMNILTINMVNKAPKEDLQKAMSVRVASAEDAAKIEKSNQSGAITRAMYASLAPAVKAAQDKIADSGKAPATVAFSADNLVKNIPGLSQERAKEISDKLNKQLQDSLSNNQSTEKPKSPKNQRELQESRLKEMFDTGMLKTAATRIASAVASMDAVAHAKMGELAKEFQALQQKMIATARDIVKEGAVEGKTEQGKPSEKQQQLFDLIGQIENKRTEALKTLSEFFKYGPVEKPQFANLYGNFGGENKNFADKIKDVMSRIKA